MSQYTTGVRVVKLNMERELTSAGRWVTQMIAARGIEGVRVLRGFLSHAKKYPAHAVNQVGNKALEVACFRLRPVRRLYRRSAQDQKELSFKDRYPT